MKVWHPIASKPLDEVLLKTLGGSKVLRKKLAAGWVAALMCAFAGSIGNAAVITITNVVTADAGTVGQGQSFTPSINDGYVGSPETVLLMGMSVGAVFGNFTYPDPSEPVYLHIYSSFLAGPGNGEFGTPSGLLGVSNNAFVWDTTGSNRLSVLNYTFSSVELNYAATYYALFSTSQIAGEGLVNRPSFNSGATSSYPGGGEIQTQGAYTIIAADTDMYFTAEFATIPEPSTAALGILSGVGFLVFRNRKRFQNRPFHPRRIFS